MIVPFTCCKLQVLTGELLSSAFCFVYVSSYNGKYFWPLHLNVYVITPFHFNQAYFCKIPLHFFKPLATSKRNDLRLMDRLDTLSAL